MVSMAAVPTDLMTLASAALAVQFVLDGIRASGVLAAH